MSNLVIQSRVTLPDVPAEIRAEPIDMMTLPTGIYPDISASDYHKRVLGLASKTALDKVNRSLAHYLEWVNGAPDEEDDETPALFFGKALHTSLLEPDVFGKTYVVAPDFGDQRKKENKERRTAWQQEFVASGQNELPAALMRVIAGMTKSVRAHTLGSKMLENGQAELTLKWTDHDTKIPIKSRVDFYAEKFAMVVDVKTTMDARPEAFTKSVTKWRYHVQDSLYRSGFAAVGKPIKHFVFLAIEKEPPYAVAAHTLDMDGIAKGLESANKNLRDLEQALREKHFPAYDKGINQIQLKPWA